MACFQFVSEAVSRTISKFKLNHKEMFNVDHTATNTRSIEHTLKFQHGEQYQFITKPKTESTLVGTMNMTYRQALETIDRFKLPTKLLSPIK